MAGGRVYGGSNMTLLLQNEGIPCSSEALEALLISSSSSSSSSAFNGSRSMVSFEDVHGGKTRDRSFFRSIDQEDNGDEEFDECFHQPEKKRRLTVDQVQLLEKNFEVENKLEPERKIQLARELGLQPRQVAIWFQNRRARWKTKQLEKDYESLNASFNSLKSDYEKILKEKETLKNEVLALTEKLLPKEKEKEESKPSYTNKPSSPNPEKPVSNSVSEENLSSLLVCKQEDLSSANSGIFDSDSPHYADSSHVFEPENSDLSQDEEDNLSKNFLHPPFIFPKLEDEIYPDPPANYCNYGFSVEDQAPWFWSY